MERYKLILSYDGTAFSGSQRQAQRRTVQAELEKAVLGLSSKAGSVVMAGRTDAGVHAMGQVAALDLQWSHGPESLRDALNAKLPADMAVAAAEPVEVGFHPRFDAVSRRYRYQLLFRQIRDPLRERLAWRIWPPVSARELQDIARTFLGEHDFGAFGSAPHIGGATVRTVTVSEWTHANDECHFEIAANGFLYRMVRRLVFVQVALARGKCSKEAIARALENPRHRMIAPTGLAPAHGLTLVAVTY
jgi:tRNA pseudouridine38-40 synthase